jgi:hypothetical protein
MEIYKLLEINKIDFINFQTQQFNLFCELYAKEYFVPERVFQTNEMLFNWYCNMWKTACFRFQKDVETYVKEGIKDAKSYTSLFRDAVLEIPKHYPGAILEEITKKHYKSLKITSK